MDTPLLGRNWLERIWLDWASIRMVQAVKTKLSTMVEKYSEVFEDTGGVMTKHTAHLTIKPQASPRFCRPRAVPFSIKGKELDRLEEIGTLRRGEYAAWAAPIVPVPKKDGGIRICGDYKLTINPHLKVDQYPLPKPSDLMACLTGGKKFTKLDLRAAY